MRSFAVYLIGIVVILGYNLVLLTHLDGAPRLTTLASNACTLLDGPFSLLRKHTQSDFSSTYKVLSEEGYPIHHSVLFFSS